MGLDSKTIVKAILNDEPDYACIGHLSLDCLSLLEGMLDKNPVSRLTIQQILQMPFLLQ